MKHNGRCSCPCRYHHCCCDGCPCHRPRANFGATDRHHSIFTLALSRTAQQSRQRRPGGQPDLQEQRACPCKTAWRADSQQGHEEVCPARQNRLGRPGRVVTGRLACAHNMRPENIGAERHVFLGFGCMWVHTCDQPMTWTKNKINIYICVYIYIYVYMYTYMHIHK